MENTDLRHRGPEALALLQVRETGDPPTVEQLIKELETHNEDSRDRAPMGENSPYLVERLVAGSVTASGRAK